MKEELSESKIAIPARYLGWRQKYSHRNPKPSLGYQGFEVTLCRFEETHPSKRWCSETCSAELNKLWHGVRSSFVLLHVADLCIQFRRDRPSSTPDNLRRNSIKEKDHQKQGSHLLGDVWFSCQP